MQSEPDFSTDGWNRIGVAALRVFLFCAFWMFAIVPASAKKPVHVPEALKPWTQWVLEGMPSRDCAFLSVGAPAAKPNGKNAAQAQRVCAWGSALNLTATAQGARFDQLWTLYDTTTLLLPGEKRHWPVKVRVGGKPLPVTERNGHPTLTLKKGSHRIEGRFEWNRMPQWLTLGSSTGLVRLTVDGKKIDFPQFSGGRIGLGLKENKDAQSAPARIQIKVFRKIYDDVPLTTETRLVLDVSGPGREVVLGHALLSGHHPLGIASPLPARLEADGRLRLQVKPGHWEIVISSRHPRHVLKIPLTDPEGPWADEEIWSFQANTSLRHLELSGLPAIDPVQSGVPLNWRQLPAFRVKPGDVLTFKEKRRGNAEPASNVLHLKREMWLDFTGEGYTVQDRLTGTVHQGWRLDAHPKTQLGRVNAAGRDQLITQAKDGTTAGVEVRQGATNLTAVSRMQAKGHAFPAVGWLHDVQSLNIQMHLPPGYRLFTATGVDAAHTSFISRWTLFDLFILLMITAAVSRLLGRRWGVVAFFTIGLLYHEPHAPVFVWLSIVASLALLNVLPVGRFRTAVVWYRNLSLLALAFIALPFMIDQARQSIYPQLEGQGHRAVPPYGVRVASKAVDRLQKKAAPKMERGLAGDAPAEQEMAESRSETYFSSKMPGRGEFKRIDPNAQIQTGPGLPAWRWNTVRLSWSGPVGQGENVKLYLIPPIVNRLLGFVRIFLIVALTAGLLLRLRSGPGFSVPKAAAVTAGLAALLLFSGPAVVPVSAEMPTPAMLQELKQRLLAPPECGDRCFEIQRAEAQVEGDRLTLRLEAHVEETLALPLPGRRQQWLPQSVVLDGKPAAELVRFADKPGVWLRVTPGIHQVVLTGPLPETDQVQVYFPRRPHRFAVRLKGWQAGGIQQGRLLSDSLQLTRIQKDAEKSTLRSDAPPVFVVIERLLHLGLDWQVITKVRRVAPPQGPINFAIPLIDGESVLTEEVRMQDGNVLVSLGASARQAQWVSTLEKTERLKLTAPNNTHWVELWTLDVSPTYHVDFSGIPPVLRQGEGVWQPKFRPWPGESLTLDLSRPQAVPGSTLAIDAVELRVSPGTRMTQSDLKLKIRSSQGGQHPIVLPENAQLDSVTLNGKAQPIRQEGTHVALPIRPGEQDYHLRFSMQKGVTTKTDAPRIDLGHPAANVHTIVSVPANRWLLFVQGPSMGPAVLFWGELFVVVVLSILLGRYSGLPLKTGHWMLLGVAMSTIALTQFLIVVVWLFALSRRETLNTEEWPRWQFNLMQAGLGLLTVVAVGCLFFIIGTGLLSSPDMAVVGNHSSSHSLHWFADRIPGTLPDAWFVSLPLLVYRVAILLWALWVAFALLGWLKWGWTCFSRDGLWRKKTKVVVPKTGTA